METALVLRSDSPRCHAQPNRMHTSAKRTTKYLKRRLTRRRSSSHSTENRCRARVCIFALSASLSFTDAEAFCCSLLFSSVKCFLSFFAVATAVGVVSSFLLGTALKNRVFGPISSKGEVAEQQSHTIMSYTLKQR